MPRGHGRRYIKDMAGITAPLKWLLKKDMPWARNWGDEQQQAIDKLKR